MKILLFLFYSCAICYFNIVLHSIFYIILLNFLDFMLKFLVLQTTCFYFSIIISLGMFLFDIFDDIVCRSVFIVSGVLFPRL